MNQRHDVLTTNPDFLAGFLPDPTLGVPLPILSLNDSLEDGRLPTPLSQRDLTGQERELLGALIGHPDATTGFRHVLADVAASFGGRTTLRGLLQDAVNAAEHVSGQEIARVSTDVLNAFHQAVSLRQNLVWLARSGAPQWEAVVDFLDESRARGQAYTRARDLAEVMTLMEQPFPEELGELITPAITLRVTGMDRLHASLVLGETHVCGPLTPLQIHKAVYALSRGTSCVLGDEAAPLATLHLDHATGLLGAEIPGQPRVVWSLLRGFFALRALHRLARGI